MAGYDEQELRFAYEALSKGDTAPMGAVMAQDYVWHVPAMGLTARGKERTRDLVSRIFDRLQITEQRLWDVQQHGEFVVCTVSGRSALRPDEYHGVDVHRLGADGLAVEGWSHRPLLPDEVDVRQLLDWQD